MTDLLLGLCGLACLAWIAVRRWLDRKRIQAQAEHIKVLIGSLEARGDQWRAPPIDRSNVFVDCTASAVKP